MKIFSQAYGQLSADQLYGMLQLRSEVFVVEQKCIYHDLDGNDRRAVHVWGEKDGEIVACLRIYRMNSGTATIGRVVTKRNVRGTGLGLKLVKEGISICKSLYPACDIVIHAQCYAVGFYEKCGFSVSSEEFLEDGIPHREMKIECR